MIYLKKTKRALEDIIQQLTFYTIFAYWIAKFLKDKNVLLFCWFLQSLWHRVVNWYVDKTCKYLD